MSRKQRREEPNERQYKQMETFHQVNSQHIELQLVSFHNEQESNLSNPSSMLTFGYINGQKKRREE